MNRASRIPAIRRTVLITGGAGFIGTNLAHRLLAGGNRVTIFDNLSRAGAERNLRWLRAQHRERLGVIVGDVREPGAVAAAVRSAAQVFHLAAPGAVTTSMVDPVTDSETNIRGTLNVLEALRQIERPIPLLFASTSNVYGPLHDVPLAIVGARYSPPASSALASGVSEDRPLDFHSPYGCSKGAADQYVLDYARSFRLPATVFRLGSIYGPHACLKDEQAWVAHFLVRALLDEPVTIHGDGRQVRDLLFVDDLVDAMIFAQANLPAVCGRAFNIGGGPANTISLLELVDMIRELHGPARVVKFAPWRPADQRYYASNVSRFSAATGWIPRVNVGEGIRRLHRWLIDHRIGVVEPDDPADVAAAVLEAAGITVRSV